MSEQDAERRACCCESGSADAGNGCACAGPRKRWKTLIFLLLMGAAVAVLVHALVKGSARTAASPARPPHAADIAEVAAG